VTLTGRNVGGHPSNYDTSRTQSQTPGPGYKVHKKFSNYFVSAAAAAAGVAAVSADVAAVDVAAAAWH